MDIRTPDDIARDVARAAKAERRLLERERRAERDLVEAERRLSAEQDRLDRALRRVEKRRADGRAAAEKLRRRQAERAAGPDLGPTSDGEIVAHPDKPTEASAR